jgi:diguanylate cyclase (GGDEF)-like protein
MDFHTTLIFAVSVTLLFTVAVALLWPGLKHEPAYQRLLLWNILVFASQVMRLSLHDLPSMLEFSIYWTVVKLVIAVYCAAALAMTNLLRYERILITVAGVMIVTQWMVSLFTQQYVYVSMVTGLGSVMIMGFSAFVMLRFGAESNAGLRYVLSAPFVLGSLLSIWFLIRRMSEYRQSNATFAAHPEVHYLAEMIFIIGNLSLLVWLYLRQQRTISHLARTDALTGALNRRGLEEALGLARRSASASQPGAIVMIDIDHFKHINDSYGHRTGDAVLKQVSNLVIEVKRPEDLFARLGGEEYCLLLPEMSLKNAAQWAEHMRVRLQDMTIAIAQGESVKVTASFGVASCPVLAKDWQAAFDQALASADDALYAAKKSGRNRVKVSEATTTL